MTKEEIKYDIVSVYPPFTGTCGRMAMEMMRHCIGLDTSCKGKKPYHRHGMLFFKAFRNQYGAGVEEVPFFEVLVELGFATCVRRYGDVGVYRVTDAAYDIIAKACGISKIHKHII